MKKNLTITTVFQDGKRVSCHRRAGPGKLLTPAGIDELVRARVAETASFFPRCQFAIVPLRDGNFNLVEKAQAERA